MKSPIFELLNAAAVMALVACGSSEPSLFDSADTAGNAATSAGKAASMGGESTMGGKASGSAGEIAAAGGKLACDAGTNGATAGGAGATNGGPLDIKDEIFTERSGDCADYANVYTAMVTDVQKKVDHTESVTVTFDASKCTIKSNAIPNHDFDDATAHFATPVAEVAQTVTVLRQPQLAQVRTPLSQHTYNAMMLNGVVLDILSAGCYRPNDARADANGNVAVGCMAGSPWMLDPLGPGTSFGTDAHHAHTQPDGRYHYHGNPMAMFDDEPADNGSPVIGFAADGFPIYGTYFKDGAGTVRKATSGYTLKKGTRPATAGNPGGTYTGMYVDDYEFTSAGDLDECNGMTVAGQYGYYVTDSYPWVMQCFSGTPDASFTK